jgi:hypothetical protein
LQGYGLEQYRIPRQGIIADISIEGSLIGNNETKFLGYADFDDADVGQNIKIEKVVFQGGSSFRNTEIRGNFVANQTKFLGKDNQASFNALRVGKSIFLKGSTFEGPVDFCSAHIASQFNCQDAHFTSEGEINFNGIFVGDSIFIHKTAFDGSVNFGAAEIKGNFEAQNATFSKNKAVVGFFNLKVGNSISLEDASFLGGVNFYGASIGMDFNAAQTKFLSKKF